MRKHHIFILILFAILIAAILSIYFIQHYYAKTTVTINGYTLTADEARTNFQKEKGLGGRKYLAENQGMLFIYHHEQPLSFWMKGMLIPIDIIWLDKNYRVVYVLSDLSPCPAQGECPIYTSPVLAQYVLETQAGFSKKHGISIGSLALPE